MPVLLFDVAVHRQMKLWRIEGWRKIAAAPSRQPRVAA
jgi:hypothetical protein